MEATAAYPGMVDEAHPELFDIRAMPTQPEVLKAGQLPPEKIRQYFEKGYLVVEDFFKPNEIDAVTNSIEKLVDDLAQKLFKAGKIKNLHEDKGFSERMIFISEEFPGANVLLIKAGILTPELQKLWSNERLLNLVEQFVGPDIDGHPVWNLRVKTPHDNLTTVPWHQDSGYLDNDSYQSHQLTAWIPLLDATEENGTLELVENGHKTGKIARHTGCWRDTWYIMLSEEDMEKTLEVDVKKDSRIIPVKRGGMILFNNILPHRSLPNVSKEIRWSLDLRWLPSHHKVGFYGLKEAVAMRSSTKDFAIDWERFNFVDRFKLQDGKAAVDEFDICSPGPWMDKWEIVNENMHTRARGEARLAWHTA